MSFRAGHLTNPEHLPEALLAAGYLFGSDSTANDLLTHFPVHTHYDRGSRSELPVFEFPVTIEDEEKPPLGQRVGPALALADDLIRDEGVMVVLIHPNVTDHKLQFERELIAGLRGRAWFGTLGDFGRWWSARDQVQVDVLPAGADSEAPHLRLQAPLAIAGLTLRLPAGWTLAAGGAVRSVEDGCAVLDRFEGALDLVLQPRP